MTASLAETSSLATSPDLPLFGVFFHYSNILVLLLVSGIAWIYVVLFFKQNSAAHVLLVATVAGVFFTISTVFNPEAASPFRFLLFGEPWFATLVAVSFGGFLFQDKFSSRALVILLLALILGFQVFSFAIVPDYTASPRYYITESESHAKMFGYDQARGSIGTDPFFVTASAPQEVRSQRYQESEKYEPVEQEFVAGNITDQGYEYFAYRDVQVYRLSSGWWELLWDPQAPLDSSNARFYDSGSVQFYTNTTMTETFAPTRRGPTTSRG